MTVWLADTEYPTLDFLASLNPGWFLDLRRKTVAAGFLTPVVSLGLMGPPGFEPGTYGL